MLTKKLYEQATGRSQKSNVIAYQIRQSFRPGEITAEEANRIGYELASRFLKGKHAFIVATHTDREHIHNHIIYNSTALDGTRKFRDFFFSGLAVQRLSDLICLEHQLSVIEKKPYRERQKREANYINNAILNDLKILFNFEMDSRDRAAILLAGLPKLNSTLQLQIHEPLKQRIVMNYNLDGLSKDEGKAYIYEKLKGAGCNQTIFEEAAIEAILNAADGTPRLINKYCNAAILIGDTHKVNLITTDIVMQAINDCELG